MRVPNKRCKYICSIHEVNARPEFRIIVQEVDNEDLELKDSSPRAVWSRVLSLIASIRTTNNLLKLHPQHVSGDSLFGLTEPAIVRVLESLPGKYYIFIVFLFFKKSQLKMESDLYFISIKNTIRLGL